MGLIASAKRLVTEFAASAFTEYAPNFVNYVDKNPDGLVARLTGFIFRNLGALGDAKFPDSNPALKDEFNLKANRKIDITHAANIYMQVFGNADSMAPTTISARYGAESGETKLTLKKSVNDEQTGFRGAIYQDAKGHAIVVYGGMDKTQHVDMNDLQALAQAKLMHRVNHQTAPAQKLYEEAVKTSKSVEVIGYSLGSLLANDIAARFNAKSTTLANIGLPELKNGHKNLYTREQWNAAAQNSIVLKSGDDPYFGKFGSVPGHVITMPDVSGEEVVGALSKAKIPFNFNATSKMTAHTPIKYMLASEKFREAARNNVVEFPAPAPTQDEPRLAA